MSKIIMHIDLNCFFARAQVIKEPELEGKPLIIAGTSRRGIVSTASYEARKFGINSAMPTYMALKLCPNVIIRNPDFNLYHDLSQKFFNYVKKYTEIIEIASIDECYADMTECMKDCKDPIAFLKKLQDNLFNETKLMCSIGLAPTKFLAKMASDMKKPMGITIIRRKDIQKLLWPLPIKDMFGIGKKTYPKLEKINIKTIGDFALDNQDETKKILGKFYYVLKDWAYGKGSDEVITEASDPKSIGNSTTFLFDTDDYDEIRSMIYQESLDVSKRAEKENKIGYTITLNIKDSDFKMMSKSETIQVPTNSVEDIYNNALKLYDTYFVNKLIRLVGVTLSNLISKKEFYVQMSFFDIEMHKEKCATKILINELNNKCKKNIFMKASELGEKNDVK
ncbi:MAG: DNA polymerase IV [Bacilli bacterium]|nr:DNA polymerase IV [Bacillales bacterium]MDY2574511.1 DNA polymerase IV [Bacilli bacterium]